MAWVAVDKNGSEWVYNDKPFRGQCEFFWNDLHVVEPHMIRLPRGTIKKLIGRELTWDDEPVELK